MITTANYVARKFGVRSAMPGFVAMKLCPELLLVPCNYRKYKAVSDTMKEVVSEYDPHFASMGLDEVNMDVTDFLQENNIDNDEGR
jgi:DNA polymerase kappa